MLIAPNPDHAIFVAAAYAAALGILLLLSLHSLFQWWRAEQQEKKAINKTASANDASSKTAP